CCHRPATATARASKKIARELPRRSGNWQLYILTPLIAKRMLYPISISNPSGSGDDLICFIDPDGRISVSDVYAGDAYFSEGKACVVNRSGKSGFIDYVGNVVIPFNFDGLGMFREGLCSKNGGFIDHAGRWFIPPRFLIAAAFSEGRAFVSLDGDTFGFVDLKGDLVISPKFQQCRQFSEGLSGVYRDERWGYIDHQGQIKIPHVFEETRVQGFRDGLAGVKIDGMWGFIDPGGNFAVKPQYEDIGYFSEGHAPVRQNGKWGLIDLDGRQVVDRQFNELGQLDGGLAPAKINDTAGFISGNGSWVIQPAFDKCYRFIGKLAVARKGNVYYYLRRNGETAWTSEPGVIVQAPRIVA